MTDFTLFFQLIGQFAAQHLPELLMLGLMVITGCFGALVPFAMAEAAGYVAPPYVLQGFVCVAALLLVGLIVYALTHKKPAAKGSKGIPAA